MYTCKMSLKETKNYHVLIYFVLTLLCGQCCNGAKCGVFDSWANILIYMYYLWIKMPGFKGPNLYPVDHFETPLLCLHFSMQIIVHLYTFFFVKPNDLLTTTWVELRTHVQTYYLYPDYESYPDVNHIMMFAKNTNNLVIHTLFLHSSVRVSQQVNDMTARVSPQQKVPLQGLPLAFSQHQLFSAKSAMGLFNNVIWTGWMLLWQTVIVTKEKMALEINWKRFLPSWHPSSWWRPVAKNGPGCSPIIPLLV